MDIRSRREHGEGVVNLHVSTAERQGKQRPGTLLLQLSGRRRGWDQLGYTDTQRAGEENSRQFGELLEASHLGDIRHVVGTRRHETVPVKHMLGLCIWCVAKTISSTSLDHHG